MTDINAPRAYDLSDPSETARLLRECAGYLNACRLQHHGTDFAGRQFAMQALEDPHLLSEIETLRTRSGSLVDAIQHGDDEHRAWLKAAITAHFAGEPVPPVSGSGRKDAEIETLRARLAATLAILQELVNYDNCGAGDYGAILDAAEKILASRKENTDG